MPRRLIVAMTCFVALAALSANAAEFLEDFDDGAIDPEELTTSIPPGWAISYVDGKAVFEKLEGTGNGFLRMTTAFTIKGDFEATVVTDRTDPAGVIELGLVCSHLAPVSGFSDVYFYSSDRLISNTFVGPIFTPLSQPNSATPVTFRIRRVGNQLIHDYDDGGGYQQLASHTDLVLGGPVKCGLFNGQENGNATRNEGTFDEFAITAAVFTGDCGNGVVGEGEECDDDDPAWETGQYCGAACTVVACGDPNDSGSTTATDALFVLQAGVSLATCDACVCDVDSSGSIASSDALMVLNASIGSIGSLSCPVCP